MSMASLKGELLKVVVLLMLSWCCLHSAVARILLISEPKVSDGWLLVIYLLGSSCSTRFSFSSSHLIACKYMTFLRFNFVFVA